MDFKDWKGFEWIVIYMTAEQDDWFNVHNLKDRKYDVSGYSWSGQ